MPLYDDFDAAHQLNHVEMAIEQSMAIASDHDVYMNTVYAIAEYHDTGVATDQKGYLRLEKAALNMIPIPL